MSRQAKNTMCTLYETMRPIIGITADQQKRRHSVGMGYAKAVYRSGGIPVILPPVSGMESHFTMICDGFIFSGGDDPAMEQWGIRTHPKACPVSSTRQAFELALLERLSVSPETPVLGVCLGMQWMGLLAGGTLEQDLPESLAETHRKGIHRVEGEIGEGMVHTHHHQALQDAGALNVIAVAEDGVIEAVRDHSRVWYVGVQWHPERTEYAPLGQGLFDQLIEASYARKVAAI